MRYDNYGNIKRTTDHWRKPGSPQVPRPISLSWIVLSRLIQATDRSPMFNTGMVIGTIGMFVNLSISLLAKHLFPEYGVIVVSGVFIMCMISLILSLSIVFFEHFTGKIEAEFEVDGSQLGFCSAIFAIFSAWSFSLGAFFIPYWIVAIVIRRRNMRLNFEDAIKR